MKKSRIDYISILVISGCLIYLVVIMHNLSDIKNVYIVGLTLLIFPLSFRIPGLLMIKNRSKANNNELIILSTIYIIGLIIYPFVIPNWIAVFMYPIIFILMLITSKIERYIRRRIFKSDTEKIDLKN